MIRSTDYLLHKHFGKTLGDKNVEILDPATGTGTFITDIIDYLPKAKLKHKYKNELHANEVAILPYYIANLNIEYTYKQKMGEYEQFDNLCFVDTLDNTGFHWVGKQGDLFGVTAENAQRIKRQNEKKISVVIGNPPYNANQQNENDNNKNREYTAIDKRIKETFINNSTAQKTKMYDMYSRFYRWAIDRLNDNGVIAFISNRSFMDSRTFDGFRKTVQEDFDHIYIVDTKSDVRTNPKISGTAHNVFGIQAGVAVLFLVKSTHKKLKTDPCKIEYVAMDDFWKKEEKLAWFSQHDLQNIEFENITPDKNNNWINNSENDWDSLIAVCSKEVKSRKAKEAIFELFSNGVVTARDQWVRDFNSNNIENKIRELITLYNADVEKHFGIEKKNVKDVIDYSFKWSRSVKNDLFKGKKYQYKKENIIRSLYRPFTKDYLYFGRELNEMQNQLPYIFGKNENKAIAINGGNEKFAALATNLTFDFALLKFGNGQTQCLPFFRYSKEGKQSDNITDWAVEQFTNQYANEEKWEQIFKEYVEYHQSKYPIGVLTEPSFFSGITKENIFHYVYAVLHNPAYRKKYELNLKREFPRIPFYDNFYQWVKWGEQLMNLHINYETSEPYNLEKKEIAEKDQPKAKLKALKDIGVIVLDDNTELHGVPKQAWDYKLGNRSALEWVLDQYKEKKPSDPTIAEKFNTYKFDEYKDQVIDLLKRVCIVSVETMNVVKEMSKLEIKNDNKLPSKFEMESEQLSSLLKTIELGALTEEDIDFFNNKTSFHKLDKQVIALFIAEIKMALIKSDTPVEKMILELRAYQRVYKIDDTIDEAADLMPSGFHSALTIIDLTTEELIEHYHDKANKVLPLIKVIETWLNHKRYIVSSSSSTN